MWASLVGRLVPVIRAVADGKLDWDRSGLLFLICEFIIIYLLVLVPSDGVHFGCIRFTLTLPSIISKGLNSSKNDPESYVKKYLGGSVSVAAVI